MHDFFHVLGLAHNAPITEVRRACARRLRRSHPDFRAVDVAARSVEPQVTAASPDRAVLRDTAIDFVDVATLVDRIQRRFFTSEA